MFLETIVSMDQFLLGFISRLRLEPDGKVRGTRCWYVWIEALSNL